ncbi:MAG TPA: PAS domain-containing protein, partial [Terriglobales bacterium]|nr:PAS domain-containing protein [Terriglobales bacterium]
MEEIVRNTLDAMELTLGFDNADFWTIDNGSLHLQSYRGRPFTISDYRITDSGVVTRAARTMETIRVSDAREVPDFLDDPIITSKGQILHMLSELTVPIIVDREPAAVLNVESTQLNAFSAEDQILLETLAAHVASALTKLRHSIELQRSSQFLESIVANANVWMDVIDQNGNILLWNKAAESISGYSQDEVIGHGKVWEWLYPDAKYRQWVIDLLPDLRQEIETSIKRKDGETRIISWIERNLVDNFGRASGSIVIGRDVTDQKRMEHRLRSLHEHALKLASSNEMSKIVEHTLDAVQFALGFDFADITVVENQLLRMVGHRGEQQPIGDLPLNGKGVTVKAATTKIAIRVDDTRSESGYVDGKGFDWIGNPTMLSELAVPVLIDGETVAVLNVESKKLSAFTIDDQNLLELLAFHVGSVFKRIRYEEKLKALDKHAFQLSVATSLDDIVRYTLDAMEFGLGFDYADLRVVENGWLFCRGARGMVMINADLPLDGSGVTVRAVHTKKTVRVSDTRKVTFYVDRMGSDWEGAPTMLSELAVPVIVEQNVVAVLNVENTKPNTITDDDQTLMETLATHVNSAITRLRHQVELQRYSEHLEELVKERSGELAKSEERFREAMDATSDGLWDWNVETEDIYFSPEYYRILGYEPGAFPERIQSWKERIHPEDLDRTVRANEDCVENRSAKFEVEFRMRTKEGGWKWILGRGKALVRDTNGRALRMIGTHVDITDRKRMEGALRSAGERLQYTIDSNPAVVYLGKPLGDRSDYYTVYKSKSVLAMLGFEPEQFIGPAGAAFWASRVHPDDLVKVMEAKSKFWKEGHGTYEYRFLHKDGTYRWIFEEATVIRDSIGAIKDVTGCWTDVTERKKMEEQIQQMGHMAAVGQTAAMVGHDLRNPLQATANTVYLLRKLLESGSADDRKDAAELLDELDNQVYYMDKIVSDLQDYSRPVGKGRIETNLLNLIKEASSNAQIPGTIQFSTLFEGDLTKTMVNPILLKRVLLNLVMNAVQAMPNGGKL